MDKVDRLIKIIRIIKEEIGSPVIANSTNNPNGPINIAGLPPDQPPVFKKKKNNIFLGKGSRINWLQRRTPPQ